MTCFALRFTEFQELVSGEQDRTVRQSLVVDLAALGLQLDSMVLKVFSNLNDSMILWPFGAKAPGKEFVICSAVGVVEKQTPLCPSESPAVAGALVIGSHPASVAGLAHEQPSEIGSTSPLAVAEHTRAVETFSSSRHFGLCDSPAVIWEGQRKPDADPGITT
ncbi:hypothetical protein GRJ2_002519800 [Grus japonensis]|uniref:Uncharacterized protein n=1 Tax=Grus japonensis TaxID=30415 RepID=A0ABC9XS36_GRUJA